MRGPYVIKDINFSHLDDDHSYIELEKSSSGTKLIKLTDISRAASFDSESDAKVFIINELIIGHDRIIPSNRANYKIIKLY